jgi:hypothetical protein
VSVHRWQPPRRPGSRIAAPGTPADAASTNHPPRRQLWPGVEYWDILAQFTLDIANKSELTSLTRLSIGTVTPRIVRSGGNG